MSRNMLVGVMICIAASTAVALPEFQLPAEIQLMPGSKAVVPVGATSLPSTPINGMLLYVQVDAPIEVTDINFDGTIWPPQPPIIVQTSIYPELPDPQHGYASVTTSASVILPSSGLVANVAVWAPADTPVGSTYLFRLEWPEAGAYSIIGPPDQISVEPLPTTVIRIVPEPATICLLLAAGGFVARKRC